MTGPRQDLRLCSPQWLFGCRFARQAAKFSVQRSREEKDGELAPAGSATPHGSCATRGHSLQRARQGRGVTMGPAALNCSKGKRGIHEGGEQGEPVPVLGEVVQPAGLQCPGETRVSLRSLTPLFDAPQARRARDRYHCRDAGVPPGSSPTKFGEYY